MNWDLNLLRALVTLASFVAFVVLVLHTWSRRRAPEHAAAAALPLEDEQGVNRE